MTQRAQIDATLKLATVGPVLDRDLEHLRQTQPLAEALHDEPRLAQVRYWLGRLHYASGDFPVAVAHAEAIRMATAAGDKLVNALAHRTLAAVLADCQPSTLQRADSALLEAVRLHKDINNQPELARSYVDYARFLQRQQKSDEAITYLTRGIDMFRHMGMAWDFARAEQILGTVS